MPWRIFLRFYIGKCKYFALTKLVGTTYKPCKLWFNHSGNCK